MTTSEALPAAKPTCHAWRDSDGQTHISGWSGERPTTGIVDLYDQTVIDAKDAEIERLEALCKSRSEELDQTLQDLSRKIAECERLTAERKQLAQWMADHNLIAYHPRCRRPDGTNGPAWVVRKPYMVEGGSCDAWHPTSAEGALIALLTERDKP